MEMVIEFFFAWELFFDWQMMKLSIGEMGLITCTFWARSFGSLFLDSAFKESNGFWGLL